MNTDIPAPAAATVADRIEALFENRESAIARDLKLNLLRFVNESGLPEVDRYLAGLAVARAAGAASLAWVFAEALAAAPVSADEIREAQESAALLTMLNTYYRFRHMVGPADEYRQAGLRMTALAKPALGKHRFEQLAFAVSVVNGCETCIKSHEKALREGGLPAEQVHELARLAAVVRGVHQLFST
jgi:lipoyl-dependent peroxiredoxin subunit D